MTEFHQVDGALYVLVGEHFHKAEEIKSNQRTHFATKLVS